MFKKFLNQKNFGVGSDMYRVEHFTNYISYFVQHNPVSKFQLCIQRHWKMEKGEMQVPRVKLGSQGLKVKLLLLPSNQFIPILLLTVAFIIQS